MLLKPLWTRKKETASFLYIGRTETHTLTYVHSRVSIEYSKFNIISAKSNCNHFSFYHLRLIFVIMLTAALRNFYIFIWSHLPPVLFLSNYFDSWTSFKVFPGDYQIDYYVFVSIIIFHDMCSSFYSNYCNYV